MVGYERWRKAIPALWALLAACGTDVSRERDAGARSDANLCTGVTCGSPRSCEAAGACNPATGTCVFPLLPAGTACRAAVGPCDAAETCTGTSPTCPDDALRPAGMVCRAPAGTCDRAEACSGASPGCPDDEFEAPGKVCRSATSECDVAESCTGSASACPADAWKSDGTPCSGGTGTCAGGRCLLTP